MSVVFEREVTPAPYVERLRWSAVTFVNAPEGPRAVISLERMKSTGGAVERLGDEYVEIAPEHFEEWRRLFATTKDEEAKALTAADVCAARIEEWLQLHPADGRRVSKEPLL